MKEYYNIGELVNKLKINKETVRYYEKIGLLSEPKRGTNGYRLYSREDMEKLWFILIAKAYDFSLKEIKELLSKVYNDIKGGDIQSIRDIMKQKINEIGQKISELEETKQLLQKVNNSIASPNNTCGSDFEDFLKRDT